MNDREYFEKLAAYVSEKIPHEHGRLVIAANDLREDIGMGFSSTYNFLLQVRKGFGIKLYEGPVGERVSALLRYLGAQEGDSIVNDSREYFGERFQFSKE